VLAGELAIESLPSAAGSFSGVDTAGQRVETLCDPHGARDVAPELPNSHQTRPSYSNELPLSPELTPYLVVV
jgi:hypothetical protein